MQIIIVAGTNGKTTTSSLIKHLLETDEKKVLLNKSGANLLNGIASTLLLNSTLTGKLSYDFAIFEIDENVLPHILKEITPNYLVLLNLFRDQLDRYGEVHTIADKWEHAINKLSPTTKLVLNADDPEIAWLGLQHSSSNIFQKDGETKELDRSILYFGLNDKSLHKEVRDHAVDSVYCPKCNFPLEYNTNYYSHLGDWYCPQCKLTRPKLTISTSDSYPLPGTYNKYNTHAAALVAANCGISNSGIKSALQEFKPAFGRQEIVVVADKKMQLFLSKNPISFNQSLETISTLGGKNLLIVLNDRVADGHDVSWIWDTNLEQFINSLTHITISGDRCYDMALRIKYAETTSEPKMDVHTEPNIAEAHRVAFEKTDTNETLYVLPTYTAMLDVRKIVTGKKIL